MCFEHNLKQAQKSPPASTTSQDFQFHFLCSHQLRQEPHWPVTGSQTSVEEIILRQLLKLISLLLLLCSHLNYGQTDSRPPKLVEPATLLLSADRLRDFVHVRAFSCILFALKTRALNSQGKHILSHQSGVLRGVRSAASTGRDAGKTVPTRSLAPLEEHLAGPPHKSPLLTVSEGTVVLAPKALLCGTILCGCRWPWALLPASPSPELPHPNTTPQHNALPQEHRTDPQSCSGPPRELNFFLMILSNTEELCCHCEARG